jgi:hypothetical protein
MIKLNVFFLSISVIKSNVSKMNTFFKILQNNLNSLYDRVKGNVPAIILVYFSVVFVHFISSNIYPSFCCPFTFWGFIMSPFMVVTPHCEALRWVIHYTGEQIRNYWIWLGGYLVWYFGNQITPYINTFRSNATVNRETNTNIIEIESTSVDDIDNIDNTVRRRTRRNNNNGDD